MKRPETNSGMNARLCVVVVEAILTNALFRAFLFPVAFEPTSSARYSLSRANKDAER